jgi:hypothetical protein
VARPWALTLVAALLLPTCATAPREPWLLTTDELREVPVRDLDRISTYPQALATTLDIMQRDLGLPALQVKLLFLPDTRRLETALVRIGHPAKLAHESARELIAIAGHRVVLINQSRLEREGGWPTRLSFLAHELAHVLQDELGGGTRGVSAQWLREGFAEWVEMRVMERLGRDDGEKARQRAIMRIRIHAQLGVMALGRMGSFLDRVDRSTLRLRVPPLAALRSFPDWIAQSRGEAGVVLYDYAFIAALLLLEEHGLAAVLRYFELSAQREDSAVSFLEAFGEAEEPFEKHLREVIST